MKYIKLKITIGNYDFLSFKIVLSKFFQDLYQTFHIGRKLTIFFECNDHVAFMAFDIQNIIVHRLPVMEIHRIRFPDKGDPKTFRRHLDRGLHAANHTDFPGRHAMLSQDRVLDLSAALPGCM